MYTYKSTIFFLLLYTQHKCTSVRDPFITLHSMLTIISKICAIIFYFIDFRFR